MTAPMNFAVIGCGALAQGAHIPNIAALDKAVLHTCCDLSDEALATCRDDFGALNISKDFVATLNNPEVEAICLATTEKMRLPVIELAAKLGKPVYCEKPLAATLEEMYVIQKVVNDSGIPFCVGHNRRASPAMREGHRIFREHMTNPKPCPWRWEREGDQRHQPADDGVAAMSVRINDDWYSWKGWVFDDTHNSYGPMLFEMTHFTDLCNWFMDAEPEEVSAISCGTFNHGVIIKYATGEIATINMTANGTFGYPKELYEMMGNGGVVVVDHMLEIRTAGLEGVEDRIVFPMIKDRHPEVGTEGGLYGWLAKKRAACAEAAEAGDNTLIFTGDPDKGHFAALENFIDEIRGTGPVVCGVDDAVRATRVSFAALRSAEEKRVVRLDEV
jgi:myo-inositol 2-dehydrogenase / D-chiro-inositol 1-dehydrogenase